MRPLPANLLFLTGLVLLAPAASALPTDRDQPVQISANSARFNEKTGIATYTGAVVIRQGSMEMTADEITITTDAKGAVLTTVARGSPARYQQQTDPKKAPVSAEAARIDYDARNEVITLTGKARLRQEGSSFQGSTITYNSQRQQVDAKGEGAERVMLVLPPQLREQGKDKKK
ncbi:MAG TPA: lipopolysaccharide transport periplasmic protein LptA [Moraxellaceae bacterium]|nr:lipopolysaccharide transport periplasmic protein LptA [Moraxellaceae bacterium]